MKKLIFGISFLIIVILSGCKKSHCYYCYDFGAGFMATKNGDTVWVGTVISRVWLQDSLNHYTSLGYIIDTVIGGYHPDPGPGVVVCDTNSVYIGQPVRDSCAIII